MKNIKLLITVYGKIKAAGFSVDDLRKHIDFDDIDSSNVINTNKGEELYLLELDYNKYKEEMKELETESILFVSNYIDIEYSSDLEFKIKLLDIFKLLDDCDNKLEWERLLGIRRFYPEIDNTINYDDCLIDMGE